MQLGSCMVACSWFASVIMCYLLSQVTLVWCLEMYISENLEAMGGWGMDILGKIEIYAILSILSNLN